MLVNDECEIILQPIRSICRIPSTIVLILVYYIKIKLVEPNFEVGIFVFPITCVKTSPVETTRAEHPYNPKDYTSNSLWKMGHAWGYERALESKICLGEDAMTHVLRVTYCTGGFFKGNSLF